jgi:hypothetical protein
MSVALRTICVLLLAAVAAREYVHHLPKQPEDIHVTSVQDAYGHGYSIVYSTPHKQIFAATDGDQRIEVCVEWHKGETLDNQTCKFEDPQ